MLNRFGSRDSNPQNGEDPETGNFPVAADTGTMLRERREAMGVSLAEVEAATRIRQKYLSALESNDWHLLPGEIVGRGFLRNYAAYLNLDPSETLARRRATMEPRMAAALSHTSAGAMLPPERRVDYRPKEVDLKDEGDDEERTPIRRGPILAVLLAGLLLFFVIQNIGVILNAAGGMASGAQDRIAAMMQPPEPTATPDLSMAITAAPIFSSQEMTPTATFVPPAALDSGGDTGTGSQAGSAPGIEPTPTAAGRALTVSEMMTQQASAPEEPEPAIETPPAESVTEPGAEGGEIDGGAEPTPTLEPPTPEPPTPEPPTATPTEEPPTPEPAAPVVQAPVCPDSRSIITSPGNGQVLSGLATILGTATHEAFQNYKLEYAPGADASGGYAYFDGDSNPVIGGNLGVLNTPSLANGTYTIRLTVVDQTANWPPPCQVTVTVQN